MTKRWLVTGGAGFIGGHLVKALLDRGQSVTVLDNFTTGRLENLASALLADRLQVRRGDIRNPNDIRRALRGVAGVYHCAAEVGVQDCIDKWTRSHQANVTATIDLFQAVCRQGGVPVVYASSAAVYGDRSDRTCHEDLAERPISPYGADKMACEHQARAFWHVHGLPTAGLRLFNVFGPRQAAASPYSGVLARFCRARISGGPVVIFGDGMQSRDFVYVGDVVSGMIRAMTLIASAPQCLISNICTGRATSLANLLRVIDARFGTDLPPPEMRPARPGDIRHSCGDPARMAEVLGLADPWPLERGVGFYLQWLRVADGHTMGRSTGLSAAE